jgi:hypothetical protein
MAAIWRTLPCRDINGVLDKICTVVNESLVGCIVKKYVVSDIPNLRVMNIVKDEGEYKDISSLEMSSRHGQQKYCCTHLKHRDQC